MNPHDIDWNWIYAEGSLMAASEKYQSTSRARRSVLAGIRGLSVHLGLRLSVPEDHDPEVEAVLPPAGMVHLLAALGDDGLIGHVAGRIGEETDASRGFLSGADRIEEAEGLVDAVLRAVSPLLPGASRPKLEYAIGRDASGDSHALSAGLAAVVQLMEADVQSGIAATGGWDQARGCFRPVPAETIPAKLQAAARWGMRRVLVVEGQELPPNPPIEVISIPANPAALPLAAVQHVVQGADASKVREALGIYDMQVARHHLTSLESILEFTEQFIDPARCDDDILRQIAADMRSRAYLHRGDGGEARRWLEEALSLRGRAYLPEGPLGDYLLYQQAAHHSIVMIDQGLLEDVPGQLKVHAEVDRLIEELEARWCTRHQSLLRMFLRNTRARRNEYLARLALEQSMLEPVVRDLLAERSRWDELIEEYARRDLKMRDTDLRRQHNLLIDVAMSRVSLVDPVAYGSCAWRPEPDALVEELSTFIWTAEVGDKLPGGISRYDLVGLLKWWCLRGGATSGQLNAAWEWIRKSTGHDGAVVALPWPVPLALECLLRLDEGTLPMDEIVSGLQQSILLQAGEDAPMDSVLRLLSLRTRALLASRGEESPEIIPPESGTALRRLHDRIVENPSVCVARCPY